MITKDTARDIFNCYFEIEKAEKLLEGLNESLSKMGELKLKDSFGQAQSLQLGIPSGASSTRLYNIPDEIAVLAIESHIKRQNELLKQLEVVARGELNTQHPAPEKPAAIRKEDIKVGDMVTLADRETLISLFDKYVHFIPEKRKDVADFLSDRVVYVVGLLEYDKKSINVELQEGSVHQIFTIPYEAIAGLKL